MGTNRIKHLKLIIMGAKAIISFNSVVETEVKACKTVDLTDDELLEFLVIGSYDKENIIIEVDEVTAETSIELNEMFLGLVPDELKNNCVSMVFTDIKVTIEK